MQIFKLALPLVAFASFSAETIPPAGVVVHEWGTFTSVADRNGAPVIWNANSDPGDLPCFVVRSGRAVKSALYTRVRMETPVIYFYSPRPTVVSVKVAYPAGAFTEWYPQAASEGNRLAWNPVEILPGTDPELPKSAATSHYYAARETGAAPLRVGSQSEKLLFYRGAGDFPVPVRPRFTSAGRIEIANASALPVPLVLLFDNHDGKTGFRAIANLSETVVVNPPAPAPNLDAALIDALTGQGLYLREARAMVATWRDSWFEEGTRVFYLVPRPLVDAALPLEISPRPETTARVFVGRVEMLSPWLETRLRAAFESGDTRTLAAQERFLPAFLNLMRIAPSAIAPAAAQFVQEAGNRAVTETSRPSCAN